MSRREQRARRERISRAIADYRNWNTTKEQAAQAAGMTLGEFERLLNNDKDEREAADSGEGVR